MNAEEEDYTLGTCGCVDYHMADCPLKTSSITTENLGGLYDEDF